MRIQHNIMAMNAYRNYNNNTSALSKNLEKLSSGYKINRAGDDAAGLAISEKMRAQITGLQAAQKNVKDGVSLVKTAEGAMQEIQDMLNRMDYLATQSANGTYDNEVDRANLQKEVDALKTEINRIADSANFNGIKLLDGSLDSDGVVAGTGSTSDLKQFTLPAQGSALGTNTVLHAEASTDTTGTEFSLDLHNVTFDNRTVGNKMEFDIGGNKITLEVAAAGTDAKLNASGIVDAIMAGTNNNYTVTFTPSGGSATQLAAGAMKVQFNGQDFTMTDNGTRLSFKQDAAPTAASQEVAGDMAVNITASIKPPAQTTGAANVAAAVEVSNVGGTAADINTLGTDAEINFDNLDTDAITTAAIAAGAASGNVEVKYNSTAKEFELYAGSTKIGSAAMDITTGSGTAISGATDITFADGSGNNLGKITVTPGTTTGSINDTTFGATAYDSSLDYTKVDPATAKTINTSGLDKDAITKVATKLGLTDGNVTVAYDSTGGKFQLKVGNTVIGETADATGVDGTMTFTSTDGENTALGTITGQTGTTTANWTAGDVDTALDYKAPQAAQTPTIVDYNKSTTDIKNVATGKNERLASTRITITADMVKEGHSIQIGKENYVFKVDKDSSLTSSGSTKVVDVSDLTTTGATYLSDVLTRLTDVAATNSTYTVGHDNAAATLTVTEKVGQTDYVDGNGKSSLTSVKAIAETLGYKGVDVDPTAGKALTLQIGDTSDSYNQMEVNVGDMHVAAMAGLKRDASGNLVKDSNGDTVKTDDTIASIDISTQQGAQDAVSVIKDAINYVSSIRGDLGAIQNRLEHTQNNLSVMAENIQDAESTIRDTDVAEEMMSYVKNNILVQSAQAMLAQANQVPQGVLQLLG